MSFFNYENNNFYYEIIGNGPALVLSHPYMSSTTHWHKSGWVDILSKDNTKIEAKNNKLKLLPYQSIWITNHKYM